jgi:predicted phage terminase large subunit-like protein
MKDEDVRSPDQRAKNLEWYKKALMPAGAKKCEMVILNTPMHTEDIIMTIMSGTPPFESWHRIKVPAMIDGRSIDEDWKTTEELLELAKDTISFASEYMCEPVNISSGLVKEEDLRYYDVLPQRFSRSVMHIDCTHTGKQTSDYYCIILMGITPQNTLYVIDHVLDKGDQEQQARQYVSMYDRWREIAAIGGIEKLTYDEKSNQGFGHWLKKLAREEYNLYLPVEELRYPSDKVSHFTPHVPIFKSNSVFLPHTISRVALDQLLAFPQKGVHDDFVDGLSGAMDQLLLSRGGGIVTYA